MDHSPFSRAALAAALLALLLAACGGKPSPREGADFLLSFYRAYATEFLSTADGQDDSLLHHHATAAFYEKAWRMRMNADSNPLLRAQDFTEHALQTLRTSPLQDEWYEVSWQWHPGGGEERIPVRLEQEGDTWRVSYVTPYYYGAASSDTLFFRPGESPYSVCPGAMPADFLRSFVQTYAALFATLQPGAEKRAATLRKAWLSDSARADFDREVAAQRYDGYRGYDPLLAGFDCDRPDISQIRIDSLDERLFEVHFPHRTEHLCVALAPAGGSLRIDRLRTSYDTASLQTKRGLRLVERFYDTYLRNELSYGYSDTAKQRYRRTRDSLEKHYLTKVMQDRVKRIWDEGMGDYVPLTIAQEYSEGMLRTLRVEPMGKRWYRVRYWWKEEEVADGSPVEIAIHLTPERGERPRIDYFTPPYEEPKYGDSVFFEQPPHVEISQASPEEFLRTFYQAYTSGYCSLQTAPEAYADSLRALYLTENAQEQWRQAPEAPMSDLFEGYDLLLDGYYFERAWQQGLRLVRQDELTYRLLLPHKKFSGSTFFVSLRLVRDEKGYRIDSIATGSERKDTANP